jgi:hypothetical protein
MATIKLSDSLAKVDDSVTVYRYDNGWMMEIRGDDHSEEWVCKKIICSDLKNVLTLLEEYSKINLR